MRCARSLPRLIYSTGTCCALLFASAYLNAQKPKDLLRDSFENPPASARPLVWWHWLNGNITKEGIQLDLEWMSRAGVAGFQAFDAAQAPQIVDHRLAYMTPEWKDAFKSATILAKRLNLEVGIAGSPGWSETGGPWVPPSEGMKKYVWSELRVHGGRPITTQLPHPPTNTGAFQGLGIEAGASSMESSLVPTFYADSAVIAYRLPESDGALESLHPRISSSESIDLSLLSDGELTKSVTITLPKNGGKAWIEYDFERPTTLRAMTVVAGSHSIIDSLYPPDFDSGIALESSEDGKNYSAIVHVQKGGAAEHTVSFPPVTTRFYRVTFVSVQPPADLLAPFGMTGTVPAPTATKISELVLHTGARLNRFEEKAAFVPMPDLYEYPTTAFANKDVIRKADVVDLTSKMRADGTLDWTPPQGEWEILRFGYSLTGTTNHPATKEATGLEVDKLNARFVRHYMDAYLNNYRDAVGTELMGKQGLGYMVTDSWEAGAQNWTDEMIQEFRKRRGYDPLPWMPVLAGRVVASASESDRFLWDFRKTIADLISDEHYGQVEASLKERGMGHYGESHEDGRTIIADGMEVKKFDDVPMGAMWAQPKTRLGIHNYNADDRESASVAHIYGQNLAAAESFTTCRPATAYEWSPATLKQVADLEFLNGINRIVIHESALQPLDKAPGVSLGNCGQWFNRHETWAEQARPWTTYLARNSWLLQQGRFAADVAYFYGEDTNVTQLFHTSAPPIPSGYNYDFINADAVIHELSVVRGELATKSGMRYRMLVLDPYSRHMSLPVLRAIHQLVQQGAVVVGAKPEDTPSLADDLKEFATLNDALFGKGAGIHRVGKGAVYAGQSASDALHALEVPPDFSYSGTGDITTAAGDSAQVQFIHRRLPDGDLYFIDNRTAGDVAISASFRVTGKLPELWYAETGTTAPTSYSTSRDRTVLPLRLGPYGSVFVVFLKRAKAPAQTLPAVAETSIARVDGPWTLRFQAGRGAPEKATFEKLISWPDSTDNGIKYFSGEGTYTSTVQLPADAFGPGKKLFLDLGDVKNLAVVSVNGSELGTVWHTPYRVDATSALKAGDNSVTIGVINSWVNRLIGDQQPDVTSRITFTTSKPYKADSPLVPSGLLGPVTVILQTTK